MTTFLNVIIDHFLVVYRTNDDLWKFEEIYVILPLKDSLYGIMIEC
jgi:hypothetical protein